MRARSYDPVTGRFITPDPAVPNPQVTESYKPYSFANNNPHLYSDPTGLFTVTEINVGGAIQSSLRNLRAVAIKEAREYGLEKAQEFAVDFLVDVIKKLIPQGSQLEQLVEWTAQVAGTNPEEAFTGGNFFEDKVTDLMCKFVGGFLPDSLYLFPSLRTNGKVVKNGVGCGGRSEKLTGGDRNDIPATRAFVTKRPDYLISNGSPVHGDRTLLLGDIKLSAKKFLQDYTGTSPNNPLQFQAIVNHSHSYGLNVSVFFTANSIPKSKLGA